MSEKSATSAPTHRLLLKDKDTGDYGEIGAGWQCDDGYIAIKLYPGVLLDYERMGNKLLTLFPRGKQKGT